MRGLGVLAYAVAVFQRGSLAASGLEFQHRFHAGAPDLSLLAVLQLEVYTAMRVPAGLQPLPQAMARRLGRGNWI